MVDLVYYLTNLLFFCILLLYYYINLRSSIIFYIFYGYIYLSLGILYQILCFLFYFQLSSNYPALNFLRPLIFYQRLLLSIKSLVASVVFWIALFEAVLSISVADCLAWSTNSWLYLLLKLFLKSLPIFLPIFLAKDKNP